MILVVRDVNKASYYMVLKFSNDTNSFFSETCKQMSYRDASLLLRAVKIIY